MDSQPTKDTKVADPIHSDATAIPQTSGSSSGNEKGSTASSIQHGETAGWDAHASKALIRKIDWHLIPFLALLYLLSFLDRTNIGNARLDTLEADLGLNKDRLQYNDALAIFFPFYVAAEVPSNMMLKKVGPSKWIPSIMVAWGIFCVLLGVVKNYAGLMAIRALLGVAEGGLFPGVTYYITLWYKRAECGLRMAIFFSAATAAGAFGGLLAYGIMQMRGRGNLAGWQWIFILEGILTVVVAIVAFFVMYDYPETSKFLTQPERDEVHRRLVEDRSSLADEFDMKYFWQALRDPKIWAHMIMTFLIYTGLYSYSLFLPTIIKDLGYGYSPEISQLMTVPPYFVACIFCIGFGYAADRIGQRGVFMGICNLITIVGLIMLRASDQPTVKYIGCFFTASGIYPNVPQGVAWNGNNIGGSLKRGVGIAMHVGFGNLGGTLSAYLFLARDGPKYHSGLQTLLAFQCGAFVICTLMSLYLRRENARRDREIGPKNTLPTAWLEEDREKGDYARHFRYVV